MTGSERYKKTRAQNRIRGPGNTVTRGCQAHIVVWLKKNSIYSMASGMGDTGGLTLERERTGFKGAGPPCGGP